MLVEPGWADTLIDALRSPGLSAMLLLLGGVAIYIELHAPGIGMGELPRGRVLCCSSGATIWAGPPVGWKLSSF